MIWLEWWLMLNCPTNRKCKTRGSVGVSRSWIIMTYLFVHQCLWSCWINIVLSVRLCICLSNGWQFSRVVSQYYDRVIFSLHIIYVNRIFADLVIFILLENEINSNWCGLINYKDEQFQDHLKHACVLLDSLQQGCCRGQKPSSVPSHSSHQV